MGHISHFQNTILPKKISIACLLLFILNQISETLHLSPSNQISKTLLINKIKKSQKLSISLSYSTANVSNSTRQPLRLCEIHVLPSSTSILKRPKDSQSSTHFTLTVFSTHLGILVASNNSGGLCLPESYK